MGGCSVLASHDTVDSAAEEKRSRKKAESSSESSGGAAADAITGGRTGTGRGECGRAGTGVI